MRVLRFVVALLAPLVVVAAAVPPAAADPGGSADPVTYVTPVDAPVVDGFRPPDTAFGAGNRGVDFAALPGDPVRAAATGEVVFAGQVGGKLHVVVLHGDGIRTSYSFLADVAVRRGDHVEQGATVGLAGGPVHFGARAGEAYLDPLALLGAVPPEVRLVPDDLRRPLTEERERSLLGGLLARAGPASVRTAKAAIAWAWAEVKKTHAYLAGQVSDWEVILRTALHYAREVGPAGDIHHHVDAYRRSRQQNERGCTPATEAPPPPSGARRIVVLVGGLGSSTGGGAILDVDTASLGYAPDDVVQFSYNGDRPYDPADTGQDIRVSADHLVALLTRLRAEHPGVTVDLIAHSQGGLVVREALTSGYSDLDPSFPPIGSVVTLGTPHRGTDLATALTVVGATESGQLAQSAVAFLGVTGVDPKATSITQMAETSDFIRELNERPIPPGIRMTSIAASNDLVVPNIHSHVDGAHNVVVFPAHDGGVSLQEHDALPGSVGAHREIALALAGRPPTCRTLGESLAHAAIGANNARLQDSLGALITFGLLRIDRRNPFQIPSPLDAVPIGGKS